MKVLFVKITRFTVILTMITGISLKVTEHSSTAQFTDSLIEDYKNALEDAVESLPEESKDFPPLNINDNEPITVVNFTNNDTFQKYKSQKYKLQNNNVPLFLVYESPSKDSSSDIWVTRSPDLNHFCFNLDQNIKNDPEKLNERLTKLLGLNPKNLLKLSPDNGYQYISVISVLPGYIKRPTLNPKLWDIYPKSKDVYDSDWVNFVVNKFRDNLNISIKLMKMNEIENIESLKQDYPWTGLGYTYDWDKKNGKLVEVGLDEFVIFVTSKNFEEFNSISKSQAVVNSVVSTKEYCEKLLNK